MYTIDQQLSHLDKKIKSHESEIRMIIRLKKRLREAITSDSALIIYPYDSSSPEAVFLGDKVMTKYGNEGLVVNINHAEKKLSIAISSDWEPQNKGNIEEFSGDRISFIMELNKDYRNRAEC